VQRTGYGCAPDNAVGKRTSAVWTTVLDCAETLAGIEDGEFVGANPYRTALTRRNVFGGGDANPVHTDTVSIG
jgi:hypothetical protein